MKRRPVLPVGTAASQGAIEPLQKKSRKYKNMPLALLASMLLFSWGIYNIVAYHSGKAPQASLFYGQV